MNEHKLLPAPPGTRGVYYQIEDAADDPKNDTLKVVFYPVMYFRVINKGHLVPVCAGPSDPDGWDEISEYLLGYDAPGLEFDWTRYAYVQHCASLSL